MTQHITKISEFALKQIKKLEGFSAIPYRDSCGIWTIGYGSTYYNGGAKVTGQDVAITEQQASEMLKKIIEPFERGVDSVTRDDVSQNQFDALVIFAYNVGLGALKSSTLLKLVNENPYNPLIKNEFLKWNKGTIDGKLQVIKGLTNRRQAEIDIYFA